MDCAKVGRLILQLRKEKGLTQQQVAQRLNISNKTVSKWECGLGSPDVSVWDALSQVLGADVRALLQGVLDVNRPDVGKMNAIRFYVCPSCGNILTSTGEASIACCGRTLPPLVATAPQPGHTVTVQEMDLEYYVSLQHEMGKGHYLSFLAYVRQDQVLLYRLYPEQDAAVRLPILPPGGSLYVYCTRHGLQKCPLYVTNDSHSTLKVEW